MVTARQATKSTMMADNDMATGYDDADGDGKTGDGTAGYDDYDNKRSRLLHGPHDSLTDDAFIAPPPKGTPRRRRRRP